MHTGGCRLPNCSNHEPLEPWASCRKEHPRNLGEEKEVQTLDLRPPPQFLTFPASSSSLNPSFFLSFLLFCPDSIRTQQET